MCINRLLRQGPRPFNIFLRIELPPRARARHVTHLAEKGPLHPWAVVLAEAPEDPGVRVGVSPIEAVLVVEVHERFESGLVILRPPDDVLPPQHPYVVVHFSRRCHLALGGVPEFVVRLAGFKLFQ